MPRLAGEPRRFHKHHRMHTLDAAIPEGHARETAHHFLVAQAGGLVDLNDPRVPAGDLDALVTEAGEPLADVLEVVDRRFVAQKLREECGWTFDCHCCLL